MGRLYDVLATGVWKRPFVTCTILLRRHYRGEPEACTTTAHVNGKSEIELSSFTDKRTNYHSPSHHPDSGLLQIHYIKKLSFLVASLNNIFFLSVKLINDTLTAIYVNLYVISVGLIVKYSDVFISAADWWSRSRTAILSNWLPNNDDCHQYYPHSNFWNDQQNFSKINVKTDLYLKDKPHIKALHFSHRWKKKNVLWLPLLRIYL